MKELYEYSTPELIRLLGLRFKEYRMRCNLTQKEVAEQSGIGLTTIHKFENGISGNLSLATFILLLKESVKLTLWTTCCPSCQNHLTLCVKRRKRHNVFATKNNNLT